MEEKANSLQDCNSSSSPRKKPSLLGELATRHEMNLCRRVVFSTPGGIFPIRRLSSDPSFLTFFAQSKFSLFTIKFPSYSYFWCFYATNFATNIKTPRISELCECCDEYKNVTNFSTIFCTTFKTAAKSYNNATNFYPTFSFYFPTFICLTIVSSLSQARLPDKSRRSRLSLTSRSFPRASPSA